MEGLIFGILRYAYIYRFNTKIRLTMLCLSGFELYSRWVPLISHSRKTRILCFEVTRRTLHSC